MSTGKYVTFKYFQFFCWVFNNKHEVADMQALLLLELGFANTFKMISSLKELVLLCCYLWPFILSLHCFYLCWHEWPGSESDQGAGLSCRQASMEKKVAICFALDFLIYARKGEQVTWAYERTVRWDRCFSW